MESTIWEMLYYMVVNVAAFVQIIMGSSNLLEIDSDSKYKNNKQQSKQ